MQVSPFHVFAENMLWQKISSSVNNIDFFIVVRLKIPLNLEI
jgi:hypothetical protein